MNERERYPDAWLELYDGRQFYFKDDPDNLVYAIAPEWIAMALSRACRYAGHTRRMYTVLEHTVLLAEWVASLPWTTDQDVLTALHHDDAEAIIGDLPRPIKEGMPEFKALEAHLDKAFSKRFDTEYPFPGWLKLADACILVDERAAVMNPSSNKWGTDGLEPLRVRFKPWLSWFPWLGRRKWLAMHRKYSGEK